MMEKSLKCIINFSNEAAENSHWQELCVETKAVVEDFNTFLQPKAAKFFSNQHFQFFIYTEVHGLYMIIMFYCAIFGLKLQNINTFTYIKGIFSLYLE